VTVTVLVVAAEDVLPLHPTARPARARSPAARSTSVRPMRRILSRVRNGPVTAF